MANIDDINITKLPDGMNPDEIMLKKIRKKYGICPFCGHAVRTYIANLYLTDSSTWYGIKDKNMPWYKKLFNKEKKQNWKIEHYTCNECGARWDSPPFPYAIGVDLDLGETDHGAKLLRY